jgi:hypothetical protein
MALRSPPDTIEQIHLKKYPGFITSLRLNYVVCIYCSVVFVILYREGNNNTISCVGKILEIKPVVKKKYQLIDEK